MFSLSRNIDVRYHNNETYKLMDNRIEFSRIFALLKFGNKLDIVISHINFISKDHEKRKNLL